MTSRRLRFQRTVLVPLALAAVAAGQSPTTANSPGGLQSPRPPTPYPLPVFRRASEDGDWRRWWEQNAERFVAPRIARGVGVPLASGDVVAPLDPSTRRRLRVEIEPRLIRALRDPSPAVCAAALIALGRATGAERDDLAERLREHLAAEIPRRDAPEIREAAALALGLLGRRENALDLLEIFRDDASARPGGRAAPARLRAYAAFALGLLGARRHDALDAATLELLLRDADRPAAVDEIPAAAVAAVGIARATAAGPRLAAILRASGAEESVRAEAALALGRLGDRAAIPTLLRHALGHPATVVRRAGATALGLLADDRDETALRALIFAATEDADRLVRQAAVMALAETGGDLARETLSRLVRLGAGPDRIDAVLALGVGARLRYRERPAVGEELSAAAAAARSEYERAAFLLALGLADHEPSRPMLLREALGAGVADLRGFAALGWALLSAPATREETDALRAALRRDRDPEFVRRAAVALVQKGDADVEESLLSALDDAMRNGPAFAGVAHGLGWAGGDAAARALGRAAAAEDGPAGEEARAAAVAALGMIADKDDVSPARAFRRFARNSADDALRNALAALD